MRFSTRTHILTMAPMSVLFALAPVSPLFASAMGPSAHERQALTLHKPELAKAIAPFKRPQAPALIGPAVKPKPAMISRKPVAALVSTTNPAVVSWQITTYDTVTASGLLETTQTDALGNTTKVHTDGKGRTIEQIDALGNVSAAQYDANGNQTQALDPNGVGVLTAVYDAQNRRVSVKDTTNETRTTVYSVGGLVLKQTDAKGVSNAANTQYDARGRVTQTTSRLGTTDTTNYTYDANGNKLTLTDGEGKTTTYTYDPRNLKIAWTFPGQTNTTRGAAGYDTVQYQFDEAARLVKFLRQDGSEDDTAYNFNGTVASKTYLTVTGATESQDVYTYDLSNRPLSATKGRYNNTVSFTYDTIGRKAGESLSVGGNTYPVAYAYDADSRLVSTTYPSGKVAVKAYTQRNQLATVQFNGAGIVTGIVYDNGGRETSRTLGNGGSQARTYNADNTVATMATTLPSGADQASSFSYAYDLNKNLTQEAYAGGATAPYSATMAQDAKDRLTQEKRTDGDVQNYGLTNEGDWAIYTGSAGGTNFSETRTHNANHQITALAGQAPGITVASATPTYDAQGDLQTDEQAHVYTWDQEKNLMGVVGGATNVAFATDALGRRVSKTSGGVTTVYVSAGNQEIAEYAGGVLTKEHVYGAYVDENIATVDATQGLQYRVMDRRYSTTVLLDSTGAVLERYVYDAYGKTTALTTAGIATGVAPLTDVLWTGRKLDAETGIYYFRSRYFSTTLGRFISRDVDYLDGWSLYEGYFSEREGMDWSGREKVNESGVFDEGTTTFVGETKQSIMVSFVDYTDPKNPKVGGGVDSVDNGGSVVIPKGKKGTFTLHLGEDVVITAKYKCASCEWRQRVKETLDSKEDLASKPWGNDTKDGQPGKYKNQGEYKGTVIMLDYPGSQTLIGELGNLGPSHMPEKDNTGNLTGGEVVNDPKYDQNGVEIQGAFDSLVRGGRGYKKMKFETELVCKVDGVDKIEGQWSWGFSYDIKREKNNWSPSFTTDKPVWKKN